MNTMMFLNQFGSSVHIWIDIAFLVCLFGTLVLKPERIRNIFLFRVACLLFAISITAPNMVVFVIQDSPGLGQISPLLSFLTAIGPIFFGLSFLATVGSLIGKQDKSKTSSE